MTFEKRLKLRRLFAAICFLIGLSMILLSFRLNTVNAAKSYLCLHSFYCGGGGGMIGASINIFIRSHTLLHDPEKRREAEIKEMDERNVYLQRVSYSLFAMLSLVLILVAAFIAGFFNPLVCFVLLAVDGCQILLLLLAALIVRRMY